MSHEILHLWQLKVLKGHVLLQFLTPNPKPKIFKRGFGSSPEDTSSGSSSISCTAPCRVAEQCHGLILALMASPNPALRVSFVTWSHPWSAPIQPVPNAQVQEDDTKIAPPLFTTFLPSQKATKSVQLSQVFAHSLPSPGTEWQCQCPVNQERPLHQVLFCSSVSASLGEQLVLYLPIPYSSRGGISSPDSLFLPHMGQSTSPDLGHKPVDVSFPSPQVLPPLLSVFLSPSSAPHPWLAALLPDEWPEEEASPAKVWSENVRPCTQLFTGEWNRREQKEPWWRLSTTASASASNMQHNSSAGFSGHSAAAASLQRPWRQQKVCVKYSRPTSNF